MNLLRNHAVWTSATIVLFLVSAVSGVLMFFGLAPRSLREIHEILSTLLVPIAVLHVVCNWNRFKSYFKFKLVTGVVVLFLVSIPFLYLEQPKEKFSAWSLVAQLEHGELRNVGAAMGIPESDLAALLKTEDIAYQSLSQSLGEVSRMNHKRPHELLGVISRRHAAK